MRESRNKIFRPSKTIDTEMSETEYRIALYEIFKK